MTEKSINSGTACSIISRFPFFGAFSPSPAPLPRRIRLHPFSASCYTKGRFPAAGRIGRQKSCFQLEKERNKIGTHTYTYFHEDEQLLASINQAVSLSKLLRDNHLITNPEDIENIMDQLADNYQSFGSILSDLGEKTMMEGDIEPQSIKGNSQQVDVFLEEMKNNGFNISPTYQEIMKKLCVTSIFDCNKDNADEIFSISEQATEEEQKIITELQSVLVSEKYIDYDKKRTAFGKFISTAICESILHSQEREI